MKKNPGLDHSNQPHHQPTGGVGGGQNRPQYQANALPIGQIPGGQSGQNWPSRTFFTADDLRSLSSGACKLLLALLLMPAADPETVTGYSDRQIRRLKRELADADALPSVAPGATPNGYSLLVRFGVRPGVARRYAAACSESLVKEAIEHIQRQAGIYNPPGAVIRYLQTNSSSDWRR